jgi:uncharacterized membrane protein YeiB
MTAPPSTRRVDLDVIRAVALIGVAVMNYHGYLVLRGAPLGDDPMHRLFHPWDGPLATRFAATFVVVAGVSSSLLVARVRRWGNDLDRARARMVVAQRGVVLLVGGFLLDRIWPGTILWFYGLYFMVGAVLVFSSARVIGIVVGVVVAATAIINTMRFDDAEFLAPVADRTGLSGAVLWSLFDGTHPLLPWLAFYLVGILLGRGWPHRPERMITWGAAAVVGAVAVHVLAPSGDRAELWFGLGPWTRSPVYVAETLGVALLAMATIGLLAERHADATPTRALAATGRTTLTLYVAHALSFNLVVDWLGWIRPTGLDVALAFAVGFWAVGVAVAVVLQAQFGTGPVERLYRAITGTMPRPVEPQSVSSATP